MVCIDQIYIAYRVVLILVIRTNHLLCRHWRVKGKDGTNIYKSLGNLENKPISVKIKSHAALRRQSGASPAWVRIDLIFSKSHGFCHLKPTEREPRCIAIH